MAKAPKITALALHYRDFGYAVAQYRANVKDVKDIADEIGVSRAQLFDYISQNGITRDLGAAIRNKTSEILAGDILGGTAVEANGRLPTRDEDIIAINATLQADIIRSHRSDINRFRRMVMQFLDELEGITTYADVFEDLGEMMRSEDKNGADKLNEVYRKVISLPGRTDTLKKLGETLKILITLERQAFGMREDFEDEEIRRAKLQGNPTVPMMTDFESINRRFMKVMGSVQEVTDVENTSPVPAA
jgi:hypothetical protein